jgi:DNA-dependent RNA polymerase
MFKRYTGWQWLLIDAANQGWDDKKLFEERIQWAEANLHRLEEITQEKLAAAAAKGKRWKEYPLYVKAVQAIRRAQRGEAMGHMVAVDAICSGVQIMSCMTGCISGARATGLIEQDVRSDAYGAVTTEMNYVLKALNLSVDVSRDDAKDATMTFYYGSEERPKAIFGDKTPQLDAFYQAAQTVAPGAFELRHVLKASWQPYALAHSWKLPDGFDARVKVMVKKEIRVEIDELDHATFSYEFYENQGEKKGLANIANVTHSMDGYVLREMHRRCNYDLEMIKRARFLIQGELLERSKGCIIDDFCANPKVAYYREQYQRSTLASAVILPHLETMSDVGALTTEHLEKLFYMTGTILGHKPFPLVTVHDAFAAHPNNVNQVRWHYKEILADIADSTVLDDLLNQVYNAPGGTFDKLSFNLADQIRESNYALT